MPGFDSGVVFGTNIDLSGTSQTSGTAQLLTNGQLLIATTALNAGGTHVNVGVLTSPDSSITIGYSSPNITLQAGVSFSWTDISGAFSATRSKGYFITATSTATLPAGASQGDTIKFFVDTTQILTITASGGQIIRFGSTVSAAAGTAVSTLQGDSVELVFRSSDQCWCAVAGFSGVWNVA